MEDIQRRIIAILRYYNINKAELSRKIGLDNNSTIARIVAGKVNPSYEIMKKMAEGLPEINMTWLLSGEGEMLSGVKPEKKFSSTEGEIFQYMKVQLEEQKKMIDFLMEQLRASRDKLNNNQKNY